MATEKKLDCVILGLLAHESLSGYEIKKRMDTTLKYFWTASYGSIYPTLGSLVTQGLATKKDGSINQRNKLIYTITQEGRLYLADWLRRDVKRDELHYETLLKLFFGGSIGKQQTLYHIQAFQNKITNELPYLYQSEKILEQIKNEEDAHLYYLLCVKFGIQTYEAYLSWCKEATHILATKG